MPGNCFFAENASESEIEVDATRKCFILYHAIMLIMLETEAADAPLLPDISQTAKPNPRPAVPAASAGKMIQA